MAGFLFNLGGDSNANTTREDALAECLTKGVYHTRGLEPLDSGKWKGNHIALLGDFLSMNRGDHVYFLCGRNIYGIGTLTDIAEVDCKLGNFPHACEPTIPDYLEVRDRLLFDHGPDAVSGNRWLCTFEPSPRFFKQGVDMDVALATRPESMRRLTSNQDRTFIKLDDEEDGVLAHLVLRQNREYFDNPSDDSLYFDSDYEKVHAGVAAMLKNGDYRLHVGHMLPAHREGRRIAPEMALEVALMDGLLRRESGAVSVFGEFDFIAHQVPASPPKKFKWMDKMDIFGYRYAPASLVSGIVPPVVEYAVIEVKPGVARPEDVSQVMSYVDWVSREWAGNNPSLVKAYLLAASFPEEVQEAANEYGKRFFVEGRRDEARTRVWSELSLVSYRYDKDIEALEFETAT